MYDKIHLFLILITDLSEKIHFSGHFSCVINKGKKFSKYFPVCKIHATENYMREGIGR